MFALPIAFLAFLGAAAFADEILKRTSVVRLEVRSGRTILGGPVFVLSVGAALFAVLFTVLPLVDAHVARSTGDDYPLVLGFAGVLVVVSLVFGWCWLRTRWVWDEQGVSIFQGQSETRLGWDEIREIERSPWTWKVSGQGREVVWTRYTLGHDLLTAVLRLRRPDLTRSVE